MPYRIIHHSTFPVSLLYTPEPQPDYVDSVVITTLQLHITESLPGDILIFLTGQDEIETTHKLLLEKQLKLPPEAATMLICPIYAALPPEQQLIVFGETPTNTRKIILATNIAETSITIPGIRYVIDPGYVKIRQYQPHTGMDCLVIVPISRAEAWQRAGRAGRHQEGTCYRLYTEETFNTLAEAIVPEILRYVR